MYTANITNVSIQKATEQYTLNVEFTDGTDTFSRDFKFSLHDDFDRAKRHIKRFIDRLEAAVAEVSTISTGVVDLSAAVEPTPTASEQARADWFRNYGRLKSVQELIDLGVLTGNEAPVQTLKNKVKNDFKASYVNDM